MRKYRCWNADAMTEAEAKEVEASNFIEAAKEFGRLDYDEEPFEEILVKVRHPNGALWEIDVEAEMELHIMAGIGRRLEDKRVEPTTSTDGEPPIGDA